MLFSNLVFLPFIVAVFAGVLLFRRHHRAQKLLLLAASYVFYGWWDWRFLGLIVLSTAIDFLVGLGLERTEAPVRRRLLLATSVVANLGILGLFKYANFFIDSARPILVAWGWNPGTLDVVLPVGISFYTFQTMSYTIDVYRRRLGVCRDPFDFALFVAFFPQLVAGPIVRAADFLPQLETPRRIDRDAVVFGLRLFVLGFFKKVFVADNLAELADAVFASPGTFDTATTWLAVTAYAIQIYADFSGYSDMAIGIARALGYRLADNFDHPYLATSPAGFWRRWHISLSTWLRDYLYVPLGGNRHGRGRTYANLMATMTLGGLWHGASWHFVAWGGYHGTALAVHRAAGRDRAERGRWTLRLATPIAWAVTMVVVLVGWVLFRAPDLESARVMVTRMFVPTGGSHWVPLFALIVVGGLALHHLLLVTPARRLTELRLEAWYTAPWLTLLFGLAVAFHPTGYQPFIYFQF